MKKNIQNSIWIIVKSCLILSTISLSLFFSSCSTPNSVRSGKQLFASNTINEKKLSHETLQKNNYQIEESEKSTDKVSSSKHIILNNEDFNSDESVMSNSYRKIPSLREQMKIYTEQQDKMLDKLTFLERDIENIKNDIEDIKVTIRSILANLNNKTAKGIYGEEHSNTDDIKNDNKQTGFYLYPDEHNDHTSGSETENNTKQKKLDRQKNKKKEATRLNPISTEKPAEKSKNLNDNNREKRSQITAKSHEFELAMDYLTKRDYQGAVDVLTKLENNQKNKSEKLKTYYWLGESYFGLGNYSKAIDYFRKVIKSGDEYKKDYASIMIAESYLRIGRVEDAKKTYAKFVDEYPNSNQIPRAKKMLQQL